MSPMRASDTDQEATSRFIQYWRQNVADSALGVGTFDSKSFEKATKVPVGCFQKGRLLEAAVEHFFKDEPESTQSLAIRIWPLVARQRREHGVARYNDLPHYVAPLIVEASVDRRGYLTPARAIIARDVLEPLPDGSFAVGAVDALDTFLTQTEPPSKWSDFVTYTRQLLERVAASWPTGERHYELLDQCMLERSDEAAATIRNILALYDDIRSHPPSAPLLSTFAARHERQSVPPHKPEMAVAARLGHSSHKFPLADSQRDVLANLVAARDGEIVAVNGPPGTGKTTLLLSAIAGAWVGAALEGGDPPVIVAASSNNQAVTNIIDAFAKDFAHGDGPLAGRWLPDIGSYGLYLPSRTMEAEASRKYQTVRFFDEKETREYVQRGEQAYLRAAQLAFPEISPPDTATTVAVLHARLVQVADTLASADRAHAALEQARTSLSELLGDDPETALAVLRETRVTAAADFASATSQVRSWEGYLAHESIFLSLFHFLPVIATRRKLRAKHFLQQINSESAEQESMQAMEAHLRRIYKAAEEHLADLDRKISLGQNLVDAHRHAENEWSAVAATIGLASSGDIRAWDREADTAIRFELFRLATHYWEGRWLMAMHSALPTIEEDRKKKQPPSGRKTIEPRWRRRMMLTPCAVATFFSLPPNLGITLAKKEGFRKTYLYDFIDMLIVDEAGQALPQIAGGAFALAKKALVIGDVQQLEPISNIPLSVDLSNIIDKKILPPDHTEEDYERLVSRGVTSQGSVMRVAQAASLYHPHPNLERGLYLFEHRRCLDEIISYCNDLCYKGTLQPCRGDWHANERAQQEMWQQAGVSRDDIERMIQLKPLAYLHVDGLCTKAGGSRYNLPEAETIAAWLADHREALELRYKLPLEKIVGVVTPFAHQKRAIMRACRAKNIAIGSGEKGMTIGTVHALQGAERPVVIFSPVYSKHEDGSFIDAMPSMMNVAVSRAKDSFIVFGDMDTFSTARAGSPRALLASYLFADNGNALDFPATIRRDLSGANTDKLETLRNTEEHDRFLLNVLAQDARQIHIVSPWITASTMERAGIIAGMRKVTEKGGRISVYVDPDLTRARDHEGDEGRTHDPIATATTLLEGIGVELVQVRQLHSKIVLVDNALLCVGSFNWLSAARFGRYRRHETSLVYRGRHLETEIKIILNSLDARSDNRKSRRQEGVSHPPSG